MPLHPGWEWDSLWLMYKNLFLHRTNHHSSGFIISLLGLRFYLCSDDFTALDVSHCYGSKLLLVCLKDANMNMNCQFNKNKSSWRCVLWCWYITCYSTSSVLSLSANGIFKMYEYHKIWQCIRLTWGEIFWKWLANFSLKDIHLKYESSVFVWMQNVWQLSPTWL